MGRQAWAGHRASPARASGRARPALISAFPQRGIVGVFFLAARGIQSSESCVCEAVWS